MTNYIVRLLVLRGETNIRVLDMCHHKKTSSPRILS